MHLFSNESDILFSSIIIFTFLKKTGQKLILCPALYDYTPRFPLFSLLHQIRLIHRNHRTIEIIGS